MGRKAVLAELYRGYEIWHRPWIKRRPWRAQVPDNPERYADKKTLTEARTLIDCRLWALKHKAGKNV
jgi:hypothetical protein